mgnify:CR=1 FL=1
MSIAILLQQILIIFLEIGTGAAVTLSLIHISEPTRH